MPGNGATQPTGAAANNCQAKARQPDSATVGVKKAGRDLKKAVAKVKALPWHKRLGDAKSKAKASGKPILMLQTLGEIDRLA
jgi:hypothetical protein